MAASWYERYLSSNHFWWVWHLGAVWECHLTLLWWLGQSHKCQVLHFHYLVSPTLNVAALEAAVALKWWTKGVRFLEDFKFGSLEVSIFFLEVGEGLRLLATAAIMEMMSLLMWVLIPPKEPEPFSDIFTYLSKAVFMNNWSFGISLFPKQSICRRTTETIHQVALCEITPWECAGYAQAFR